MSDRIHNWYTSVMGFAPSLVREALEDLGCDKTGIVLDPFCGTGTTLVEAKSMGFEAVGIDANPFSAFCSKVKTNWSIESNELIKSFNRITEKPLQTRKPERESYHPHVVTNGWVSDHVWSRSTELLQRSSRIRLEGKRSLLQLAVISATKESCANVAFGPEIYSRKRKVHIGVIEAIRRKVTSMAQDLEQIDETERTTASSVYHGDSRNLEFLRLSDLGSRVKWVISSPPYPTEHDYSRISRIELELGRYVRSNADLQKIKRMQIRSNSKTVYSDDQDGTYVQHLKSVSGLVNLLSERAATKTYSFAHRYPLVVANYFGGLHLHLRSLAEILPAGAKCMYILGEQRSYLGVLIPTTDILIEIACNQLKAFKLSKRTIVKVRRGTRGTTEQVKEEATVLIRR